MPSKASSLSLPPFWSSLDWEKLASRLRFTRSEMFQSALRPVAIRSVFLSYFLSWKSDAWPTPCVISIAVPLGSVTTLLRLDAVNQCPYDRVSVVFVNLEYNVSDVSVRVSLGLYCRTTVPPIRSRVSNCTWLPKSWGTNRLPCGLLAVFCTPAPPLICEVGVPPLTIQPSVVAALSRS